MPWTADLWPRLFVMTALSMIWLLVTGTFRPRGTLLWSDWNAAIPTSLALFVRLHLAKPMNSELTVYFPISTFQGDWKGSEKHSLVFAAMKAVLVQVAGDSHLQFMLINGVVGALTVIPVYLFVRRRLESAPAALLAATVFAVHPIISRYATTDAPYSFILLGWFTGLALLSDREITAGALFSGLVCIGLAGSLRVEGVAYLAISLFMVRWPAILATVRSTPGGAVALAAGLSTSLLFSVGNFVLVRTTWEGERRVGFNPVSSGFQALGPLFGSGQEGDLLLTSLCWAGFLAPVFDRRLRAAWAILAAAIAAVIVMRTGPVNAITEHRFVPFLAFQAILSGTGAAWVSGLLPFERLRPIAPPLMAIAIGIVAPIRGLALMRAEHVFNVEYEQVRQAVRSSPDHPCAVLWFNAGDDDLNNPRVVLPEAEWINCYRDDCAARIRAGGCLYLLRGSGCHAEHELKGTGRGQTAAGACREVMASSTRKPLVEQEVNLQETFGLDAYTQTTSAVVGIDAITGPR